MIYELVCWEEKVMVDIVTPFFFFFFLRAHWKIPDIDAVQDDCNSELFENGDGHIGRILRLLNIFSCS